MLVQDGLTLADKIIKTTDQLKEARQPRESVFQNIIDLILPGLEDFLRQSKPGTGESAGRYGGFGISQLQLFADGMFGYLVAPSINWFVFQMSQDIQNEIPEIRKWTQDLTEHFRWRFNQTNFYDAMSTTFEHAGALGFANIFSEEVKETGEIIFHTYHPGELLFSENKYGAVDSVFRKCKIKAGIAVEKFGEKVLPQTIVNIAKSSPLEEYDFIHAVYPREDVKPGKLGSKNMPFASVWICETEKKKVQEKGYNLNPYHIWRYKKGSTPYGRGPAEDALVEIMQDNVIQRSVLGAAQRSVEPPMNAPGEMEGQVDLTPHGLNWYSDPAAKITPIHAVTQFPVTLEVMQRIEGVIERHFKVEFFTLLAQRESVQPRTATEIIELQGEKAAVLGRPLARFYKEHIYPIFDRVYQIDMEAGRIPPVPDILMDQGGQIKIEMLGPLAQAQKKLFQMQGYNAGMEQLAMAAQLFGPEVLDVINSDQTVRGILRMVGWDQDAINSQEDVAKIRFARMQAQREMEEQERMAEGAETAKKLAMADKALGGKVSGLLEEEAGASV